MRLLLAIALLLLAPAGMAPPAYTVLLLGGWVHDGTGAPPYRADVALRGDRIAAIGDLRGATASLRLDVSGKVVAPGFIDLHSHATSGLRERPLAENLLRQGVTTVFVGQDGSSPLPLAPYLDALDAAPPAVNVGAFVGHGSVRRAVMGNADRAPTPDELAAMQTHVRDAMRAGAFGLSSGLEYAPGTYADTAELIALAHATAPDGLYISHIRDEGGQLIESVDEVIRIAEEAGVRGQVTHHKVVGPQRWGTAGTSLDRIDAARQRGVDVASDVYPYAASSTGLTILFPRWSLEGPRADRMVRLADLETRRRIRTAIADHLTNERGGRPDIVVLADCPHDASLNGQSLADVLRARGQSVDVNTAADLVLELDEAGGCQLVLHSMSEADVSTFMQHPLTMIASDGGIPEMGAGVPHPRNYGSFARVLAHYVREAGVLSLPEALFKMSALPASRVGLTDRGTLAPGAFADVVVFDPAAVQDRATFAEPHQYAEGMDYVFVNGDLALIGHEVPGIRNGRVLRLR